MHTTKTPAALGSILDASLSYRLVDCLLRFLLAGHILFDIYNWGTSAVGPYCLNFYRHSLGVKVKKCVVHLSRTTLVIYVIMKKFRSPRDPNMALVL